MCVCQCVCYFVFIRVYMCDLVCRVCDHLVYVYANVVLCMNKHVCFISWCKCVRVCVWLCACVNVCVVICYVNV